MSRSEPGSGSAEKSESILMGPGRPSGYETFTEEKFSRQSSQRNEKSLSLVEAIGPITLTWEDINVHVPVVSTDCCGRAYEPDGERKQILCDVSGVAQPGSLLAILGSSGAGKSTLMNVLTSRNQSSLQIEGTVRVNGMVVGDGIKALSAYVQQNDMFFGTLKVREHLWFQALLRVDHGISTSERRSRVEEVLDEMGLKVCADDCIGQPGTRSGISGGEMKRLSFASELLTNPPLMFCDEPTSGLDSYMAETVVRSLQGLAAKGRTILCTIHQPSSETFALFDQLLLMADGRVAYMGPASDTMAFFADCGHPCPVNYNPADHIIHTLAVRPGSEAECRARVAKVSDAYAASQWGADTARRVASGQQQQQHDGPYDPEQAIANVASQLADQSPYKASWGRQMQALLWRCWLAQARDVSAFGVRILQQVILAVIIDLVYFNQRYDQHGVMNLNGAMFQLLTNTTFSNFYTVLNSFPLELPIFYREYRNGMYRADTYFLCKNLVEIPLFLLIALIFTMVTYWPIGLQRHLVQFLLALVVLVLVCLASVSLAYLVAIASGRIDIALAVSNPAILPLLLFGGFFLNQASIPVWLDWLRYLSWFSYGFETLVVNQWSGVTNISCPDRDHVARCFVTGDDVIQSLNFNPAHTGFNLAMLCLLIVVLRLLAFGCLWLRSREWTCRNCIK